MLWIPAFTGMTNYLFFCHYEGVQRLKNLIEEIKRTVSSSGVENALNISTALDVTDYYIIALPLDTQLPTAPNRYRIWFHHNRTPPMRVETYLVYPCSRTLAAYHPQRSSVHI